MFRLLGKNSLKSDVEPPVSAWWRLGDRLHTRALMRKQELSRGDRGTGEGLPPPAAWLDCARRGEVALRRPSTSLRLVLPPVPGVFSAGETQQTSCQL